ncbi:MAG: methylcrotonoyl-CoA carboxylase [Phototrophicales bacterium]|nr:MAG: methylcrotonoyl-CoA carboxylase [Phototrophicales bacterium]RMG74341.1 MAG: methylcrotonoyl-CoA carboxylase [Chloroflexota bacterium]
MPVIQTKIDKKSEDYQANYEHNCKLVQILEERQAKVREGGSERARQRHLDRGKLLPRERVELLLDPGTPFLELSPLAAWDMYDNETPGAGTITGIGVVSGVECLISAHEATVKGGTTYPVTLDKALRAQEIAETNHLPTLYLVESGGANLPHQADIFVPGGRTFANQARMSAKGIPQISLVFGNSTAGGAYVPGLSDYTVFVRHKAMAFLGGPPLVKMATGEEVDEETLGGTDMHARLSGLADYVAQDDADAIRIGREIVASLNWRKTINANLREPEPPLYDPDELLGIVPIDTIRKPLDMREIIARIVDGSRFVEFKPDYGATLVTGTAHINGFPVGILANNGILFSDSANKATQFIQLCNTNRTPLIYLQNITGFMVGQKYEEGGIIKHGSQMINAVANSNVPQFTVLVGGAYGAGYYAMCGRSYDPTLLFAWPTSRTAVMGAEQAAGVLGIVQENAARRRGIEPDLEQIEQMKFMVKYKFEQESDPYYGTARIWDDGMIDPRLTRDALTIGLSMSYNRDWVSEGAPHYGNFRM